MDGNESVRVHSVVVVVLYNAVVLPVGRMEYNYWRESSVNEVSLELFTLHA